MSGLSQFDASCRWIYVDEEPWQHERIADLCCESLCRWVYFTSGKAVITIPTSSDKAIVKGGASGLILAADIAAVSKQGHTTVYPSKEPTVAVVMPLAGNKVPEHKVLHAGACTAKEQIISK